MQSRHGHVTMALPTGGVARNDCSQERGSFYVVSMSILQKDLRDVNYR